MFPSASFTDIVNLMGDNGKYIEQFRIEYIDESVPKQLFMRFNKSAEILDLYTYGKGEVLYANVVTPIRRMKSSWPGDMSWLDKIKCRC